MKKCPTGYTIEAHEIGLCNCQQANRQLADAGLMPLQEGETFCAEHCWVGTADNPCDACSQPIDGETMSDKPSDKRPDWFKAIPGFRYYDSDGDLCIVLGEGGFSRPKPISSLDLHADGPRQGYALYTVEFVPPGLIVAVLYKKDWVIFDLNKSEIEYSSMSPPCSYWDDCHEAKG